MDADTRTQTVALIAGQLVAHSFPIRMIEGGVHGPNTEILEGAVRWADIIVRHAELAAKTRKADTSCVTE